MAPAHPHATGVAVYPALFILLQDSLQFGIVYTGMIQGLNNRKYFIWLFEKNRSFVKICCICDKMLHMQHSDVAYATVRHMRHHFAYATPLCCIHDIVSSMQRSCCTYSCTVEPGSNGPVTSGIPHIMVANS